MAANLVGNAFVRTRIPELRFLAKRVEELGVSTGTLVVFQSGLETLIEESHLPQPVEIIVEEVLDKLFYGLRALPVDADVGAKQLALDTGGQTMLSFMKNKFKGQRGSEPKGSQFPTHEAGLDATARKTLFEWDKVLRASADKSALKQWLYYREMIDSVERLAYVISLVERDRLPYLEFIFGKMPAEGTTKPKPGALGVLKSVKDAVEGKASTASADIKKRISDTTKEVEAFGKEQKDLANATRTANKLPKWLASAIFVAVILACIIGLTILNNMVK